MVAHRVRPVRRIDARGDLVALSDPALGDPATVHDDPLGDALRVLDGHDAVRAADLAAVAHLAAALGIERRRVQDEFGIAAALDGIDRTQLGSGERAATTRADASSAS